MANNSPETSPVVSPLSEPGEGEVPETPPYSEQSTAEPTTSLPEEAVQRPAYLEQKDTADLIKDVESHRTNQRLREVEHERYIKLNLGQRILDAFSSKHTKQQRRDEEMGKILQNKLLVSDVEKAFIQGIVEGRTAIDIHSRAQIQSILDNRSILEKNIENLKKVTILGVSAATIVTVLSKGSSMVARSGGRHIAETVLGSGALGMGVGGVAVGAMVGGYRAYKQESTNQYRAGGIGLQEDIESKLANRLGVDSGVNSEDNLQALEKMIANKVSAGSVVEAILVQSQIDSIRRELGCQPETVSVKMSEQARSLYEKVVQSKNSSIRRATVRGAVTGAVLGGVLAVGANMIFDHLVGDHTTIDHNNSDTSATHPATDLYAPTLETGAIAHESAKSWDEASTFINEHKQSLIAEVQKGDGYTHLARRVIHDYMVNTKELQGNSFTDLDPAQRIYAEDYLCRIMQDNADHQPLLFGAAPVKVSIDSIQEAIEKARHLTEAQSSNLDKIWVPKISDRVWERLDLSSDQYDTFFLEANHIGLPQLPPEIIPPAVIEQPIAETGNRWLPWIFSGTSAALNLTVAGVVLAKLLNGSRQAFPAPPKETRAAEPATLPPSLAEEVTLVAEITTAKTTPDTLPFERIEPPKTVEATELGPRFHKGEQVIPVMESGELVYENPVRIKAIHQQDGKFWYELETPDGNPYFSPELQLLDQPTFEQKFGLHTGAIWEPAPASEEEIVPAPFQIGNIVHTRTGESKGWEEWTIETIEPGKVTLTRTDPAGQKKTSAITTTYLRKLQEKYAAESVPARGEPAVTPALAAPEATETAKEGEVTSPAGLTTEGQPEKTLETESKWNFRLEGWADAKTTLHTEETNEDHRDYQPNNSYAGVFDGLGGHDAAREASRSVAETINRFVDNAPQVVDQSQVENQLRSALLEANDTLMAEATAKQDRKNRGTTASLVKVWQSTDGTVKATIANIGDSRVYHFSADTSTFQCLTLDDGYLPNTPDNLLNHKQIQDKLGKIDTQQEYEALNDEERAVFDHRNEMSQFLGMPNINPDVFTLDVRIGDRFVLTTDGVHDNLTDSIIQEIVQTGTNPEPKHTAQLIIGRASNISTLNRGQNYRAKKDDITAIVIDVKATEPTSSVIEAISETKPVGEPAESGADMTKVLSEAVQKVSRFKDILDTAEDSPASYAAQVDLLRWFNQQFNTGRAGPRGPINEEFISQVEKQLSSQSPTLADFYVRMIRKPILGR